MRYHEVLVAWNQKLNESLDRARRLGYTNFILVTKEEVTGDLPKALLVPYSKGWREFARKKRGSNWVVGLPGRLSEARDMCNSRLIDLILLDPSKDPYFDYVCAKYLKKRGGGLIVPISWLFRRESIRNLRWASLQVKIAFKTSIPVIAGSFAEKPEEIPSPRQARAVLVELLGLSDGQALLSLTKFPGYFFSRRRSLARKGVIKGEIQGTDIS